MAASNEPIAPAAIQYLAMVTGEVGFGVLRRLYEKEAVIHLQAREHLEALASVRGWKR
jgi:hypothetical protein